MYDQVEIMNKINTIQPVVTYEEFRHETRKLIRPTMNYGELAILYAYLNINRPFIQANHIKINKLLVAVIQRMDEFITKVQEHNTMPQWLKEYNFEQIETFTSFAKTFQERPMEIEG
jgi:hypothetical protein